MLKEKISMMTTRKHYEQSMPWQPTAAISAAAMYAIVCSLGLTSSAIDYFGGNLKPEAVINRRHSKQ
jgi:hypothetical protein